MPAQIKNERDEECQSRIVIAIDREIRHQLFLQHAAGLNKKTSIDRFVRYLHAVVGRELPLPQTAAAAAPLLDLGSR